MNDLIVVPHKNQWQKLKALVLDSVSSPITRRVYNLGLDEFFAWYSLEPRPGFTKATVSAWRVALEARGLGAVSINVRITAVRKLAVEAADNGLLAPELANGIARAPWAKLASASSAPWSEGSPIGGDAVSTLYGGRGIPWERILRAARFYYLRDDCVDDSTYLEARRFQM
ncbi:MAG: hypothetical protein WCB12_00015 [Bryobacteraceae bacterium]